MLLMSVSVTGVRSVDIEVSNFAEAVRFYTDVWRLEIVHSTNQSAFLRSTARYHHVLGLYQSNGVPLVRRITFDAKDRITVDQLFDQVRPHVTLFEPPCRLERPGGGYGFSFKDPEGRNFGVLCSVDDHVDSAGRLSDGPTKIAHVNLNSTDWRNSTSFFEEALGFRVIDEVPALVMLRCQNTDHHSVVICKSGGPTINHFSFEVPDIDSVMRGAARMQDNGYPIEWGIGRHGAGNNVFAYFAGPDEFPLEYTAEVLQIDSDYIPHGPEYWAFPPGRTDQWGLTAPPTRRLKRIQQLFRFSDEGFRYSLDPRFQQAL
jgi:catechol 2,3-dioxygenase-like lactoylglutathione lyase family enzyme